MWKLYDYFNERGVNEIAEWTRPLEKTQRTKLRLRFDMLAQYGMDLLPQLLAGTGVPHIYKLKVHGNVQLRPMLCRGPIDNDAEFTILLGAVEVNWVLDPRDAAELAAQIREEIILHPLRRIEHERIN
jgi:hypothetical protein